MDDKVKFSKKCLNKKNLIILFIICICLGLFLFLLPASTNFDGVIEFDGKATQFKDADIIINKKMIIIKYDDKIIEVKKTKKIFLTIWKN